MMVKLCALLLLLSAADGGAEVRDDTAKPEPKPKVVAPAVSKPAKDSKTPPTQKVTKPVPKQPAGKKGEPKNKKDPAILGTPKPTSKPTKKPEKTTDLSPEDIEIIEHLEFLLLLDLLRDFELFEEDPV